MLDGVHAPVLRYAANARISRPYGDFRSDRLDRQYSSSLLRQSGSGLRVRVEHGEVGDDDGHGQRDREHAGEGAQGADEHPDVRLRRHVPVAHRRHRDDSPPQPDRDRREIILRVVLDPLRVEYERRKDHDTEDKEKHQ